MDGQGRVVEYGRVLATRGAALRRCAYSTGTAPVPPLAGATVQVRTGAGGTSVRAVDRLSGGRRYLGVVYAWCAAVVRRVPISRAPPRCAGGAVRSSLTAAASTQQPPGAGGVSTCVRCDPHRQALLAGDGAAGATGGAPGGLGTLPSAKGNRGFTNIVKCLIFHVGDQRSSLVSIRSPSSGTC